MPNVECYRDIGAIGARLDEIEKSRIERETANEWARLEREAHVDETLAELSAKMDALNADRQTLIGIFGRCVFCLEASSQARFTFSPTVSRPG